MPHTISQILWLVPALAMWALATGTLSLGTLWARSHFSRQPKKAANNGCSQPLEPVSVLKPVKGLEPGLKRNLTKFFCLDYPDYELLFSVADARDPAIPLIQELIEHHPKIPARLFIGDEPNGPNPKVRNLLKSYREARHDWILVSDSNVLVSSQYLREVTRDFTPDVGVVTAVVRGSRASSYGGELEAMYLNTFYARWMVVCAHIGQDTVVGKSMLFRRSVARRFGGLQQLGRFLAEDQMAGQAMRMLGLKIRLMSIPVVQPLGSYSLRDFWSRHIRWGRIRRAQAPLPIFFEPFFNSVVSGLIGAAAFSVLLPVSMSTFFACHLLWWLLNDLYLSEALGEEAGPTFPLVWLSRELLAVPLWLQMISGRTVWWRGTKLRVKAGGILEGA